MLQYIGKWSLYRQCLSGTESNITKIIFRINFSYSHEDRRTEELDKIWKLAVIA
jgi:hypothetical protein